MVKRGEIYMTDLGEYKTSVEAGTRPCVIVSNNVGNHYSPFVLVCTMTGVDKNKMDTHVSVQLRVKSNVLCECITAVDKRQLGYYMGTVNRFDMKKIDEALKVALAL